jgi:hypothetical protein
MKKLIIVVSLLFAAVASDAQRVNGGVQLTSDSILINKTFGVYQFYQGNTRLNMSQLVNTMKPNERAWQLAKKAQSTNALGTIIGFAGGALIGWPLGTALAGGDPEWVMAGIGAGLIVVAIPLSQKFNRQIKQAVSTYNSSLRGNSFWDKNELRVLMKGDGVGLVLNF